MTHFVVNGVSKRGWTTWLTAASGDPRVKAIAPMVIDILNMPVNVAYQKVMYGKYSEQIKDYVNLGLTEDVANPQGKALVEMVDPYSYRRLLTQPKMLFMGTNDEFWTVDAVKHYIDSIPGTHMMTYVPNAGHGLGDRQAALLSLEAFFAQTIRGKRPSAERRAVGSHLPDAGLPQGTLCPSDADADTRQSVPHRRDAAGVCLQSLLRDAHLQAPCRAASLHHLHPHVHR